MNTEPSLMTFVFDEQQLDEALQYPLDEELRAEMRVKPEVAGRPLHVARVVRTGLEAFKAYGDRSISALILHLLYLYFTGGLKQVPPEDRYQEAD